MSYHNEEDPGPSLPTFLIFLILIVLAACTIRLFDFEIMEFLGLRV